MISTKYIAELLQFTPQGVNKWKKEQRQIILFLEKYFTDRDLEEWLEHKHISKLEVLNANNNLSRELSNLFSSNCEFEINLDYFMHMFIQDCINQEIDLNTENARDTFYKYIYTNISSLTDKTTIVTEAELFSSLVISLNKFSDRELYFYLNTTQNRINSRINSILSKFEKKDSAIIKALEAIMLDEPAKGRPFLFLFYIFKSLQKDINNIEVYKEFMQKYITNFEVLTFRNIFGAVFTDKIKNEISNFVETNLTEKECEYLIKHINKTVENIKSKIPSAMLNTHIKKI